MTASRFLETGDNVRRLTPGGRDWPEDLDALDALRLRPKRLWALGRREILDVRPRIAIVGTRRATAYGLRATSAMAAALAKAGACIVSGLAGGIDSAAHRGALEAGGATIAVLGTGLDHVFPKPNRPLQREIARRGMLISELEHEDHGMPFTFVERNRIIAGLSALTIVVEAPLKSGALKTAAFAMAMDRPVAGVPGPIDQPQSEGSNLLIRDGAQMLTSIEDALALAGLTPPPRTPRVDPNGNEGRVWSALADGGLDIDALCARSGLPAPECLAAVTALELSGSVECALTGEIRRR